MTHGLILINTAIHVVFYGFLPRWLGDEDTWLALRYLMMLVPADVINGEGLGALSMLTSAFLHTSWSHLIGNMLYLLFFGRKLEDVMGPAKFGLFYLVCVFMSSIGSVLGRVALPLTQGKIPGLGASGAVMGVVSLAYTPLILSNQRPDRSKMAEFVALKCRFSSGLGKVSESNSGQTKVRRFLAQVLQIQAPEPANLVDFR